MRKEHNFALSHIGDMNEIAMNFDTIGNQSSNSKGVKTVLVKRTRFTYSRIDVHGKQNKVKAVLNHNQKLYFHRIASNTRKWLDDEK